MVLILNIQRWRATALIVSLSPAEKKQMYNRMAQPGPEFGHDMVLTWSQYLSIPGLCFFNTVLLFIEIVNKFQKVEARM